MHSATLLKSRNVSILRNRIIKMQTDKGKNIISRHSACEVDEG